MNCRWIAHILDELDVSRLSEAERRDVESHLTSCPECARDWQIHTRLLALPQRQMRPELANRCRVAVVAHATSRRRFRRYFLYGAALAFAAAAYMLVRTLVPSPAPARRAPSGTSVLAPSMAPLHNLASATTTAPAAAIEESHPPERYSVRLMPMRLGADGSPMRAVIDRYYTALRDALGNVPALVLVESVGSSSLPADYRISVSSQGWEGIDSRAATWLMSVEVEGFGTARDGRGIFANSFYIPLASPAEAAACADRVQDCPTTETAAAETVAQLRDSYFPFDAGRLRELLEQLQDPARSSAARSATLANLMKLVTSTGGPGWDTATVRAIVELARLNPDMRSEVWRSLRGAGTTAFIVPMLESLQGDADPNVRLSAATTLHADFPSDPRVRAAFEAVARNDRWQLLRMVALRAVSDDRAWLEYMLATLRNSNLTDRQRIEPLGYMTTAGWPLDVLKPIEEEVVDALLPVLPGLWRQGDFSGGTIAALRLIAGSDNPAVLETLLGLLPLNSKPYAVLRVTDALHRHLGDPRVRTALQQLATTHVDSQVRESVRRLIDPR
jgi:hypothetical protein